MSFEQFTYTGSPWGASAPGWTVFQSSPEISSAEASALKPYFQFKEGFADSGIVAGEINGHKLPVRFVFTADPKSGRRIIAQSVDAGPRWYDQTRGRDYFAHVLVGTESDMGQDGLPVCFNPMALFLSPTFQTEFPEAFREKALQIMNGEISNEPTPDLPVLDSLSAMSPNESYSDEVLFDSLSPEAMAKLGGLVAAIAKGDAGTLFFDAFKPESMTCMATCVRLLPLSRRLNLKFATWIPENELRTFPGVADFAFVGTLREGESADPDTGLYGAPPQRGPDFQSYEDVECFRRMVDAGGADLSADDFDNLALCWEVAVGRKSELADLRSAAKFAARFSGLKGELAIGLSGIMDDALLAAVAWFELGFAEFEDRTRQFCSDCVRDGALFAKGLRTLDGDGARKAFADEVALAAEANGAVAELASTWLSLGPEVRQCAPRGDTGPFGAFVGVLERLETIRDDLDAGRVQPDFANALLAEVEEAAKRFGGTVADLDHTRNRLRYLVALSRLKTVDDLPDFAEVASDVGVDNDTIRTAILDRIAPGALPVEVLADKMDSFEAVGFSREEVLRLMVEHARQRGREEGERNDARRTRQPEARVTPAKVRCGISATLALAIAVAALLVGVGVGFLLGNLLMPEDSDLDAPLNPPPSVRKTIPDDGDVAGNSEKASEQEGAALSPQRALPNNEPTLPPEPRPVVQEPKVQPLPRSAVQEPDSPPASRPAAQESASAPQKQPIVLQEQAPTLQEEPTAAQAQPRQRQMETRQADSKADEVETHRPSQKLAPKVANTAPRTVSSQENSPEQRQLTPVQPAPQQVEQSAQPSAPQHPSGGQIPNEGYSQPDPGVKKFRKGTGKEK